MEGQETAEILISLSIPSTEFPPEPGYYDIELIGTDTDHNIEESLIISLYVQNLPLALMSTSAQVLVSPLNPTIFDLKFINGGNSVQSYDIILEPPQYWDAKFEEIDSNIMDSGLLAESDEKDFSIVIYPPVLSLIHI